MNIEQIQTSSNWGKEVPRINRNFQNLAVDVEKAKNASTRNKGLFPTEADLKKAVPTPIVGDWAVVGNTIPGTVYQCKTAGTWTNTGQQGGGGEVDLTGYTKETDFTPFKEQTETDIAGIKANTGYLTCTTAAGTAAKTVTKTGFVLSTGCRLVIKMSYANTAASPTLNVNNTGAKPFYYNGSVASSNNTWEAGETVDVYYDGTNFYASNVQGGSGSGGNMILEWNTDVATTRKQVKANKRKAGMQISYLHPDNGWINEQYVGTATTDTEWAKDDNWEKIAYNKDVEFINNAVFDDLAEEKIVPEKRIDGYYLAKNTNDRLVAHSDYNVDICKVQYGNTIKITGEVSGYIGVYAFFSDVDCNNLVKKGDINSESTSPVKVDIVEDVPYGGNYLALSKPNTRTLEAYTCIRDGINRIDEALNNSQLAIETVETLKKDIYADINNVMEPTESRDGYYLTASGNISGGGTFSNYAIDIYTVEPGQKYKLIGLSYGTIATAAAFVDESLEKRMEVYNSHGPNSKFEVNEKIQIPSNCNILVVTVYKDYNDNKTNTRLYTYDEFAINRIERIEDEIFGIKEVICAGDSLTAGSYPTHLQSLLGNNYSVIKAGVGGENSVTITGRLGGLPMLIQDKIIFKPDNTPITINLVNAYGKSCKPLKQGDGYVNPCYVQGIECTLSPTGNVYNLTTKTPIENSIIIPAKTPLITSLMTKNPYILCLWMGTNEGYDDGEDLANQYQSIIDYYGINKYLIIGLHGYITPEELKPIEDIMLKRFGAKFVNWREYACNQAIYDAGIEPAEEDTLAMSEGKCPPSLLRDSIHLTDIGYKVFANLIYKRLVDLKFI